MKNVILTFVLGLLLASCASFRGESKRQIGNQVLSAIAEVGIDAAAISLQPKFKTFQLGLSPNDLDLEVRYLDKTGLVKLTREVVQDSLHLTFSPVWLTIRDTCYNHIVRLIQTRSPIVKSIIFQSLDLAIAPAQTTILPFTIKLSPDTLRPDRYFSQHKAILVEIKGGNIYVEVNVFAFGAVLKTFTRNKIFKINDGQKLIANE